MEKIEFSNLTEIGKNKIARQLNLTESEFNSFISKGINDFETLLDELKKHNVKTQNPFGNGKNQYPFLFDCYHQQITKATIATHNGSSVCREHNIRNPKVVEKESHINPNGEHEIWKDEKVREAYHRIFDDSVKEYNEKQKREDRKIKDYYQEVSHNKQKKTCYEMIIGIYGNNEKGEKHCDKETGKEIMKKFVENWKERNPNLEMIGAYYHADEEGEPHCHIDYIPVATGYKNGMQKQASLDKAIKQQGFVKTEENKKIPIVQWEERENDYLEGLCKEKGIEIWHPQINYMKHLDTEIYKTKEKLKNNLAEKDKIKQEISKMMTEKEDIRIYKKWREKEKKTASEIFK